MTTTPDPWIPADTWRNRVALVRIECGWNVKQAAAECKIPAATWRSWEHGTNPQKLNEYARKITERTDCDYTWLVAGGALRTGRFSTVEGTFGQGILFESNGVAWSDRAALAAVG